jgi:hypothetical protein
VREVGVKRYQVAFDEQAVERFRDAARRRAVELKVDVSWHDIVREAVARYLADGPSRSAARPVTHGGTR